MGLTTEWREQRKESVNLKIEKQKFPNLDNRENRLRKNEQSLKNMWDHSKRSNICVIRVPEGEEIVIAAKKEFEEIMAENLPNLGKRYNTPTASRS